jgi:hypothetical protein
MELPSGVIEMEVWRVSLSIGRTISSYGFAVVGMTAFAASAQDRPTSLQGNSNLGTAWRLNLKASAGQEGTNCVTTGLNSCAPRTPMRAFTPKEVELLMGANSFTSGTTSHGSCNPNSCNVTATPPPSVSVSAPEPNPPITSGPPSSLGGGGSSNNIPDSRTQLYFERCAESYGKTSPNSKFQTNFTSDYGWTSYSLATGLPLVHDVTAADSPPGYVPSGGGAWKIISASTFFQSATYHTDLYVYAYSDPATTVGVLVHEWYHQNNDVPNESDAQRQTNEQNATAAGEAAKNAFNADGGAQCSN